MSCTLALCASVACAPVRAQAQAQSPATASTPTSTPTTATTDASAAIEVGRKAYTSYCTRCHGINLVVSGGAFYDLRTFPRDDKERFLTSVNKGKRAMPAWEGVVSAQDQEAIWAYIGSVNGWGK
jgi:mono/diheme cytochrome c family protein